MGFLSLSVFFPPQWPKRMKGFSIPASCFAGKLNPIKQSPMEGGVVFELLTAHRTPNRYHIRLRRKRGMMTGCKSERIALGSSSPTSVASGKQPESMSVCMCLRSQPIDSFVCEFSVRFDDYGAEEQSSQRDRIAAEDAGCFRQYRVKIVVARRAYRRAKLNIVQERGRDVCTKSCF